MSSDRLREHPADRFDTDHLTFDLHQQAEILRAEPITTKHGHRQKTLYKHAGRTIALFVMDKGAEMREHATDGTVSIQAIEGDLIVTAAGAEQHLKPGGLVILASGVRHAVKAESGAVFLLQVSLGA
ncbi:MAG: cupin domain-containing protein [Phycisphaerales bacterium JB050]